MKVHLQALGCRLNEAELETWSRDFRARGHQLCNDPAGADLLVVNTCAVTEEAVRKSRKLLRRTQRENPTAKLVVSGCYASLEPGEAGREMGVDLLVANRDKDRLVEIADRELDLHAMPASAIEPGADPLLARGRQRAFIKVQDGCRYRCTFCIVTLARGEERSRPLTEVVAEINALHNEGVQEVVLTGVHIGGYGSDIGSDLKQLVRAVLDDTDMPRVRVGSVEPWDLPGDFWRLFENPRFQPHLHLPLQSGSDALLRRMARRCRTDEYADLIAAARAQVPDFNVTTDIIVGFPGEDEAHWRETMAFVERIGFGHLHIFPYSPRSGTKAAAMPGPVSPEIKKARSRELHQLAGQMKRRTLEGYRGRRLPVLVEGRSRIEGQEGHWFGYTPNFLQVVIPAQADRDLGNRILEVDLRDLNEKGDAIVATPVAG
jgi:threonylcarbamoyladenosine tRNA methylthiotransferase MtaB